MLRARFGHVGLLLLVGGCASPPPPVVAPPAAVVAPPEPSGPSPSEVAARVLEASGGLEAWQRLEGGYAKGQLHRDEQSWAIELWWAADGRTRMRLEVAAGVEVERGQDREGAWSYDARRGARVEAEGPSAELFELRALAGAEGLELDTEVSPWTLLRGAERWWVDPETWRLVRIRKGGETIELSDYRTVGDLELPHRFSAPGQSLVYSEIRLGLPSETALAAPAEVKRIRARPRGASRPSGPARRQGSRRPRTRPS